MRMGGQTVSPDPSPFNLLSTNYCFMEDQQADSPAINSGMTHYPFVCLLIPEGKAKPLIFLC